MTSVAFRLFILLTILTGVVYPLVMTLVSQIFWHDHANGTFISYQERIIGSRFIGQQFNDQKYFWSRPSSVDYKLMPAGASNLGPRNKELKEQVEKRAAKIAEVHTGSTLATIPSDLLYTSGSGIDPHITMEAALFQLDRVVKARSFTQEQKEHIQDLLTILAKKHYDKLLVGQYVNVLDLNIALDEMK